MSMNLMPPPGSPGSGRSSRGDVLAWLGLALLLAVQYGMFRQYVEREVAWCYPTGCDQPFYLGGSYSAYEKVHEAGLAGGLLWAVGQPVPNGMVFEAEASLLFLVLGPSRLSALTLNFAHFALFQLALAGTLRRQTGRWAPAYLGVGLLLSLGTPFFVYGGLADFRLDFAGFCLYGVFLCAVVDSGVFASPRGSLVAGVAAAWLVFTRHLTAVYLAGAFVGFLGLLGLGMLHRDPGWRRQVRGRVVGALLGGLTFAALIGPVVWCKWPLIRGYYLGHIDSSENQVRGAEFGASDLLGRLAFYRHSLVRDHAGQTFLALAALCLAVGLGVALRRQLRRRPGAVAPPVAILPAFAFSTLCLLVPFTALTLFASASPTVGNVMAAALLWLVLLALLALLGPGRAGGRAATALAALAVAAGCYRQANGLTRPLTPRACRAELEGISRLYERLGDLSRRRGWTAPTVAFASVGDPMIPTLVTPVVYERQGWIVTARPTLGGGVLAVPEDKAVEGVRASDFVVLPLGDVGPDVYPFVRCMRRYRPRLLEVCRQTHLEVGRFHWPGAEVVLFMRPSVAVAGTSPDGWVPDSGLTLTGDGATLKARPRIELCGRYCTAHLPRPPAVRAELTAPGREPRRLSARLTADGERYRLVVELSPEEVPDAADLRIRLGFDAYFIPAERPDLFGPSDDTRHLVLRAPDAVTLLPAPPGAHRARPPRTSACPDDTR